MNHNLYDPPQPATFARTIKYIRSDETSDITECIIRDNTRTFTIDGTTYRIVQPPRTGCRSLIFFLIRQGIIKLPEPYEYKDDDTYYASKFIFNRKNLIVRIVHTTLDPNYSGKIIVTVRNPFDRILKYAYKEFEKTSIDRITPQTVKLAVKYKDVGNISTFWLKGRTPDYIIRLETQTQDISKLPFVNNTDKYEHINDAYQDIILNAPTIPVDTDKLNLIKNILRNDLYDFIHNKYTEDFEQFGYT